MLQAARAALADFPGNPYAEDPWQHCGPRNQPLLVLLDALVDASTAVAAAIADNCWDDCLPIPADGAKGMAAALHRIADTITAAAAAPDAAGWSLPSMTGKELV